MRIACFSNFMKLLLFHFTAAHNLGVFLVKLAYWACVFGFTCFFLFLITCLLFVLYNTHFGLVLLLNSLFWACFSVKLPILGLCFQIYLFVFSKMT